MACARFDRTVLAGGTDCLGSELGGRTLHLHFDLGQLYVKAPMASLESVRSRGRELSSTCVVNHLLRCSAFSIRDSDADFRRSPAYQAITYEMDRPSYRDL